VRRAAVQILTRLGGARALELLLAAALDPDEASREAAVLGIAGWDDPRVLDRLLDAAADPSHRIRAAAMRAFGRREREPSAIAALRRGLADPDPWVRYYACQALGRLKERAAADAVAALVRDEAGHVRLAAIEALAHLETPSAFDALLECAGTPEIDELIQRLAADPDPEVRRLAERILKPT
jgi:HEAT repeat protein